MLRIKVNKFIMTACLLWIAGNLAYASPEYSQTRGELLYSTHCIECHTSRIHWREKTLATDWHSLKVQVYRWQSNLDLELGWRENKIIDVTRYLNDVYYHFPTTEKQTITESNNHYPDSSL